MVGKDKSPKQLERHLKGVANHRRIQILMAVAKREGLTGEDLSKALNCDIKIISQHTLKLTQAGLLNKRYVGRSVAHSLSPYGKTFYHFLKSF